MIITDTIRATIQNGMHAAADKYIEDAAGFLANGEESMAQQFERQAVEARQLGDDFMEAESFEVDDRSADPEPLMVWADDDGEFLLFGGVFGNPGCDCGTADAVVKIGTEYLCAPEAARRLQVGSKS